MKYLYLLIDLASVAVPLIYSFHKKINFIAEIKAALSAILLVAVPFIIWDAYFTQAGVWGFNPNYISGLSVFGLPAEEILFFICIPYSCLFTYFVLKKHLRMQIHSNYLFILFAAIGVALIVTALFNMDRLYTFSSFGLSGAAILVALYAFRSVLYQFSLSYLVLLIPFFIVNGILTGTGPEEPVVWYNDAQNLGLRMLTIPVEDMFYGFLLLLSNTILFELISSPKYEPAQA